MQVACMGVKALQRPLNYRSAKATLRLGLEIGLAFQLLDDLDDLTGPEISNHEKAVNPFLLAPESMTEKLEKILTSLDTHLKPHPCTREFLRAFLKQSSANLTSKSETLYARLPKVELNLKRVLTSGVFA